MCQNAKLYKAFNVNVNIVSSIKSLQIGLYLLMLLATTLVNEHKLKHLLVHV